MELYPGCTAETQKRATLRDVRYEIEEAPPGQAAPNFILAMAIFPEQRTKSNNAIKLHMGTYRGSTWLPLPMTVAAAVESH